MSGGSKKSADASLTTGSLTHQNKTVARAAGGVGDGDSVRAGIYAQFVLEFLHQMKGHRSQYIHTHEYLRPSPDL